MREQLSCAGTTHQGLVREKNEDRYAIIDDGRFPYVLIIADGMGGHRSGEVASQIAIDFVGRHIEEKRQEENDPQAWCEFLSQIIEEANVQVYLKAQEDESRRGMGTTLTIAALFPEHLALAHVGDCRAYLYRAGAMVQLTKDHTLVQEMVAAGSLSPDESAHHPRRNVLTRALGIPEYVQPDKLDLPLQEDDRVLLSSDGLHGFVDDAVIESGMKKEKEPSSLVELMLKKALDAGGEDNVTVLAAF